MKSRSKKVGKELKPNEIILSPEIEKLTQQAEIIICHGGAGTLLSCLHMGKTIISVVNEDLAGNHQVEIVEKLVSENYIYGFLSISDFRTNGLEVIDKILSGEGKPKKAYWTEEDEKVRKEGSSGLNQLIFGK